MEGKGAMVYLMAGHLLHQSPVTLDTEFLQEVEGGGAGDR